MLRLLCFKFESITISKKMFIPFICLSIGMFSFARTDDEICHEKFEYVFKVIYRLSEVERKLEQLSSSKETNQGDTFTRWGRSSCPNGTALIYNGFAGGSDHLSEGGAANYVCLHKQPTWNDQTVIKSTRNNIYGAEYQVGSPWPNIYQHDVPCAVCHVSSSSIYMIPGRNICNEKHTLQYSGYLMSGYDSHKSATEFVCVDDQPQAFPGTEADHNGKLFYFVYAKCGSLKCPPYEEGKKVTCAVCSF